MTNLRDHVDEMVNRKGLKPLDEAGFEWQRKRIRGETDSEGFDFIEHDYSPFLAHAVYVYILEALNRGKTRIRLGPSEAGLAGRPDTADFLDYPATQAIPYVLETLRIDPILREHLRASQEGNILQITIME